MDRVCDKLTEKVGASIKSDSEDEWERKREREKYLMHKYAQSKRIKDTELCDLLSRFPVSTIDAGFED